MQVILHFLEKEQKYIIEFVNVHRICIYILIGQKDLPMLFTFWHTYRGYEWINKDSLVPGF